MAQKSLILVGGGGHCVSCIDVIEQTKEFKIGDIVDLRNKIGQKVLSYSIASCDDDLATLTRKHKNFLVTVGNIGQVNKRIAVFEKLERLNVNLPVIISPLAYVSKHALVGKGSIVMHHACVNAGATIGVNVIINTKALIEHDTLIGNHCHVSTAAVINGGCVIGDNVFIGSNSTIKEGLSIASDVVVGAGAVVVKSILKPGIYMGNPARKAGG